MADVQLYSRGNEVAGAVNVLTEGGVTVVSAGGVDNLLLPKNVPVGYTFWIVNEDTDTKTLLTNGTDTLASAVVLGTKERALVVKTAATVFTGYYLPAAAT